MTTLFVGGRGSDNSKGGYGDDWIQGGRGSDVIHGGHGNDALVDLMRRRKNQILKG